METGREDDFGANAKKRRTDRAGTCEHHGRWPCCAKGGAGGEIIENNF